MSNTKNTQAGFIPMLLTVLAVVIGLIYLIFARVLQAAQ